MMINPIPYGIISMINHTIFVIQEKDKENKFCGSSQSA